jgi:hypothetical protein
MAGRSRFPLMRVAQSAHGSLSGAKRRNGSSKENAWRASFASLVAGGSQAVLLSQLSQLDSAGGRQAIAPCARAAFWQRSRKGSGGKTDGFRNGRRVTGNNG